MSTTDISQRNVAHSTLVALEYAESRIMPTATAHSRLYAAIRLVDATVAFYANPTLKAHQTLVLRLDDCKLVESIGVDLGNLDPDSLIQHGLSVAIHTAQSALAGVPMNSIFLLREARLIITLANQIGSPS